MLLRRLSVALATAVACLVVAVPTAAAGDWDLRQAGAPYTGAMALESVSGSQYFNAGGSNVVICSSSAWSGDVTDSGAGDGEPNGDVDTAGWTGSPDCKTSGFASSCKVAGSALPWNVAIEDDGDGNALLAVTDFELTLTCDSGTKVCEYAESELVGEVTVTATQTTVDFTDQTLTRVSGTCPATLSVGWSALGTFGHTIYTLEDGNGNQLTPVSHEHRIRKGGVLYTGAVSFASVFASQFFKAGAAGTIVCSSSAWSGDITDSGAGDGEPNGDVDTASWTGSPDCGASGFASSCEVAGSALPWDIAVEDDGDGNPLLAVTDFELTLTCDGGSKVCEYADSELVGTVSGNDVVTDVDFTDQVLTRVSGTCPATLTVGWSALGTFGHMLYTIKDPNGNQLTID